MIDTSSVGVATIYASPPTYKLQTWPGLQAYLLKSKSGGKYPSLIPCRSNGIISSNLAIPTERPVNLVARFADARVILSTEYFFCGASGGRSSSAFRLPLGSATGSRYGLIHAFLDGSSAFAGSSSIALILAYFSLFSRSNASRRYPAQTFVPEDNRGRLGKIVFFDTVIAGPRTYFPCRWTRLQCPSIAVYPTGVMGGKIDDVNG